MTTKYYVEHEKPWVSISIPVTDVDSNSRFRCPSPDNDDIMIKGRPIRFRDTVTSAVTWHYGIVIAVNDGGDKLTVDFDGYPITTTLSDSMEYGPMSLVVEETFLLDGVWNNVSTETSVLKLYNGLYFAWRYGTAHLVASYSRTVTLDTAALGNGTYSPYVNGSNYFSSFQGPGISGTVQNNTNVSSNTKIKMGEPIEIRVKNSGTPDKNAKDLTIQMTFVIVGENS